MQAFGTVDAIYRIKFRLAFASNYRPSQDVLCTFVLILEFLQFILPEAVMPSSKANLNLNSNG